MEINSVNFHASLSYHITGHRGINASRQKKHRLSSRPHRHAAGPRDSLGIYIYFFPDFNMKQDIRLMHIHFHFRIGIQKNLPCFTIDFHGGERVVLSCSAGIDFKAFLCLRIHFPYVSDDFLSQRIKTFVFHIDYRTYAGNAEHFFQVVHNLVKIKFGKGFHIDSSLCTAYLKLPLASPDRIFYLLHQCLFKYITVFSFYADFGIFN